MRFRLWDEKLKSDVLPERVLCICEEKFNVLLASDGAPFSQSLHMPSHLLEKNIILLSESPGRTA